MKILSIATLHDASCAVIDDGVLIKYQMEERISRKKHDSECNHIINNLYTDQNIFFDLIIISNINYMNPYIEQIKSLLINKKTFKYQSIIFDHFNHHKYHAYSGYINSNFDKALCFVFDGAGSFIDINKEFKELESIYLIDKNSCIPVFKHVKKYSSDMPSNIEPYMEDNFLVSNQYSVGHEFEVLCKSYGWHYMDGGKVMGLAQYNDFIDLLPEKYKNDMWIQRVYESANIQKKTQEKVLNIIKKYSKKYNINNIVLTGGYGLNCVANNYIIENLPEINFYVDPICFDAGISIGAGFYQYFNHTGRTPTPIKNVYIGHLQKTYDIRGLKVFEASPQIVAEIIANGETVAVFQGNAEAGQRALGNRSILFDPRQPDGRDKINEIKNRELFRPFAGTILEEECAKYFEMYNQINSPYMMFAFKTKNNFWQKIPAIVHVDKTCRVQTINKNQNIIFYNIILEFYKKTGIPIIGNTSFNLAGEPLVNTFEDAVKTLKNSKIKYLYLPDINKIIIEE